jgi:hypothetical protein
VAVVVQIIHDYEHKGVNNDYLVRVSDSLAILYNDKSPMENHHLAAAFNLLSEDDFNFTRKMHHKSRVRAPQIPGAASHSVCCLPAFACIA